MKKAITIIILLISNFVYAQTGEKNFIDQNYIEVTGKAEMEIIPDEIYLKIEIKEKDYKGKQILEDLEKLMNERLIEIGIDISKDLAIKDLVSNFKNYWKKSNKIYTSKEFQLLVHDANTAGLVFQELESIGISNITIDRVNHSKIQELKAEVKVKAIIASKLKATSLVSAIDQTIGKAIFIQEIENFNIGGRIDRLSNIVVTNYRLKEQPEKSMPIIEFEKIKLEYSILTRFELN